MTPRPKFSIEEKASTGIYKRVIKKPLTKAAQKAAWSEFAASRNFDSKLLTIERAARETFRKHKLSCRWPFKIPPDAEPQLRDARELLFEIHVLKDVLESHDAKAAAFHGARLGGLWERFQVRPFEPMVLTGRKVQAGGKKGAGLAYGGEIKRLETQQERVATYYAFRDRGLNDLAASQAAADLLDCSAKTIQRAVKKSTLESRSNKIR